MTIHRAKSDYARDDGGQGVNDIVNDVRNILNKLCLTTIQLMLKFQSTRC